MTAEKIDRERLLVDLWIDDATSSAEAREAELLLAADPGLREEESALRNLHAGFAALRLELGEEFAERVMARLPRRSRAWTWVAAMAAAVVLAVIAAVLGSGAAAGTGSIVGALSDFVTASLTAGAGLIGASWQGVGDVVRSWLSTSPWNAALALVLVAALHLLLFSLLRRRRSAAHARDRDASR